MDLNDLIPIMLSAAAVVFGLLALIIGLLGKLAAQRLVRDVEATRQQALQAASSQWMRDQEIEAALRVQLEAHEAIQRFKDRLEAVMRAKDGGMESAAAIDQVAAAGRHLTGQIEQIGPRLDGRERSSLERAGDLALETTAEVRSALTDLPSIAHLGSSERNRIGRLRLELSECQQAFRDAMVTKLVHRSDDREQ